MRQGCILSPLLFNLFINELPLSFSQSPQCDPFTLPNGSKLNCLLYADDLVILSRSKQGLNNCLKNLETFNSKWLLEVNLKKTKVMVFQKTGRKTKNISFFINNHPLEIVQEYSYLGVKINTSGNFNLCQKTLAEKGLNALYKIYKHIDFFHLSLRAANKIFDAAIMPILTYGAEVWGIFLKLDFKKWDQTVTEKVHLRFCKIFLGLNRKASNYAVRGEMGRIPIQIMIIKQILKYYQYLNSKDDNSLVKQSLYISKEVSKTYTNSYGYLMHELVQFCSSKPFKNSKYLTNDNIANFVSSVTNKYKTFWKKEITNSKKLDFYRNFKHEMKAE